MPGLGAVWAGDGRKQEPELLELSLAVVSLPAESPTALAAALELAEVEMAQLAPVEVAPVEVARARAASAGVAPVEAAKAQAAPVVAPAAKMVLLEVAAGELGLAGFAIVVDWPVERGRSRVAPAKRGKAGPGHWKVGALVVVEGASSERTQSQSHHPGFDRPVEHYHDPSLKWKTRLVIRTVCLF